MYPLLADDDDVAKVVEVSSQPKVSTENDCVGTVWLILGISIRNHPNSWESGATHRVPVTEGSADL